MTIEELLVASKKGARRRDIACHYFPSTCVPVSVAKMRRWIASDGQFRTALLRAGYSPGFHTFTPKVIKVFFRFFGYEEV